MRKPQDYLMKCLGFVLLLGFISLGAIGGCNNNGGGQDGTRALTENDFSEDPSISAKADGGVVVSFLEPPGGEKPERDTGEVGTDIVPYRYNQTFEHTFCWEDEDQAAEHFMTLIDAEGVEVLKVEVNGDCVTEVIEKGNYEMLLHHDEKTEDTHPVFVVPDQNGDLGANKTEMEQGILKTVKRIFDETLRNIGFSKEARAQSVSDNIKTLLKTNACPNCDLRRADLTRADLTGANLFEAFLVDAFLNGAILAEANLNGAFLDRADLSGANLTGANLFEAFLELANLRDAKLNGADLSGANLRDADLRDANLRDAKLNGADLSGANLSRADLSGAILITANLTEAKLLKADLTEANLTGAILTRADLGITDLSGANLTGADLTGADLGSANLNGADLSGANLNGANLGITDLTEANLTGADLTGADLFVTILSGATWCDGSCICGANSIDKCVGCASIDICDGT